MKIILYICNLLHKFSVMRHFVFIFLSFILLSCRSYDVNRTLQDIDSYIMTRPDSALTVLEGMSRDVLRTERQRAHHALLYAMALDKNYIDVSEDSIASVAVNYYSRKGPMKYRARAYYYLGLAYYYQQDYDRAILEFTKAEKAAEVSDSLYLGMTKSIQGHSYYETHNLEEVLNCFHKAYDIYSALSEYSKACSVMYKLISTYIAKLEFEKAEEMLLELLDNNELRGNLRLRTLALYAYLNVAKPDRNPNHSVQLYEQLINSNYSLSNNDFWAYSFALSLVGRIAESRDITSELFVSDTSSAAYYWQYLIAKYDNDYKRALAYLEESNFRDNKVIITALNQSLSLAQRDYYESESELAEYKAKGRTYALVSVVIICLLILALGYFAFCRYIKKQKDEKDRYINYADEVSRQLKALQTDADAMPALKRKYVELYKEKFESLRLLCDNYLLYQDRTDAEKKMYSRVVDMIDEIRGDKNCIGELEFILNKDLDGLMTALRREIKAKEVDYSIYAYSIIGFDATTISNLLDLSVNQVYIRKSRIKRQIENSDSENKARFLEMLS